MRERLLDNLDRYIRKEANGCWTWLGLSGQLTFYSMHVKMFRRFKGDIIKGMCVLHTCDYGACVNPEHLFLGTKRDNTLDSVKKGRHRPMLGKKFSSTSIERMKISHKQQMARQKQEGWIYGCGI